MTTGPVKYEDIIELIKKNCEGSGTACSSYSSEGYFAVAFVTPLMKRTHQKIAQSAELVFLDSAGGVDRYGTKVFNLMIKSSLGGHPVGTFIVSSESREAIGKGLGLLKVLLKDVLPKGKFPEFG